MKEREEEEDNDNDDDDDDVEARSKTTKVPQQVTGVFSVQVPPKGYSYSCI